METSVSNKLGATTKKAVDLFLALEVAETIDLADMEHHLGLPCGPGEAGRRAVISAINFIRREEHINIAWDRSEQVWKRTTDSETSDQTFSDVKRARKITRRGLQRAKCVVVANLSETELASYQATATQLALASIGLSDDTRKNIPRGEMTIDAQRLLLSIRSL